MDSYYDEEKDLSEESDVDAPIISSSGEDIDEEGDFFTTKKDQRHIESEDEEESKINISGRPTHN